MTASQPRLLNVAPVQTATMRARDGVRLEADVYRPEADGPFPVLLMRQPYGRRIASTVCYAHPAWYAARGYIVVIQDVRGRGTSAGTFRLFADDRNDGEDTIAWAAALPGASGAVGMYGFSYQGSNQLLAAAGHCPALKALAPAMIGWDLRTDWAYENGAFCLGAGLGWATQLAAENARLAGDETAFQELFAASRALPLHQSVPARPDFITRHRAYSHYFDWIDNPRDGPYWQAISPSASAARLAASGPPMLFIGGWYDSHLPGTLAGFAQIAAGAKVPARLIVGPWGHFPWGRKLGALDFGESAISAIDELQIRWFDRWLKQADNGVDREPAITLFDTADNSWRHFSEWPRTRLSLFLDSSGRAALDTGSGRLLAQPARDGTDRLVHDPWRPAPTTGGAFGVPGGPVERSATDARPDVLTFTTAPLERALLLAGPVSARLFLGSDAASFDVSCTLSRLVSGLEAIHLTDGYCHVADASGGTPVEIPMRAACARLAAGEQLRLSVAAASFPAYPVNPGTGQDPTRARLMDARVITLALAHGPSQPSGLTLTVQP